jgi:hypothetical protein
LSLYDSAAPAPPIAWPSYLRQSMGSRLSCFLQLRLIRHGSSCVLRNTSFIRSFIATSFQYCSVHPLPIICSPALPTTAALSSHLYGSLPPSIHLQLLSFACIVRPPPYASRNLLRRPPMELASASPRLYCPGSPFTASPSWGLAATFAS